eukprot:scaffold8963_cov63-Cyclotella_meneghiniana.AAC.2
MDECLFEANGPNNDNDYHCETSNDTSTAHQMGQHHSLKSSRTHKGDVGGKWVREKIVRYEQNIKDKERQPPIRWPKTPLIENEIVKSTSRITSASSWGKGDLYHA